MVAGITTAAAMVRTIATTMMATIVAMDTANSSHSDA